MLVPATFTAVISALCRVSCVMSLLLLATPVWAQTPTPTPSSFASATPTTFASATPTPAVVTRATPLENHAPAKLRAVSVPTEEAETSAELTVPMSNSVSAPAFSGKPSVAPSGRNVAAEEPPTAAWQDPRPRPGATPVGGNRVTQKTQGQRYGDPDFMGEPINLNVVDADIRDVLNYITEQYGVNFVIDKSVGVGAAAPKVTINVSDVPWNIVLDSLLRSNELGSEVNGPVIRIAKNDVLAKEAEQRQIEAERRKKLADARLDSLPLYTELFRLNYARPYGSLVSQSEGTSVFRGGVVDGGGSGGGGSSGEGGILPIIQRRLSRRGSIEFDARTNTMIVTDIKENLDAVRKLVTLLDQPAPQVEIEARIVIANRNFSRDLGVQLAGLVFGANGAAASAATIPGSAASGGGGTGGNTTGFRPAGIPVGVGLEPGRALGANLPSTVIGLTTGIFGTAQISAAISTAEQKGQAKVVASPRVTALNNRPAQIESGQQIPVVTPQTGGGTGGALVFTTTFVSVPLRLSVTPQITDAGTVVLRIVAENNSVNTAVAINGTPGIDTQRMSSEVLVPDGGTTVVGGVLADNESEIQNRTPGISSLPVVGNLFKRKQVARQTNEILFFITPRIYRPDYNGNPIPGAPKADGTNSTTIYQPVPLGNPPSNNVPTQPQNAQPEPTAPTTPATMPTTAPTRPNNN